MKLRWLLLNFIWLTTAFATEPGSFQQGKEAYQAGEYASAAEHFQTATRQSPASGALLNLGLAEWHRGRAGAAVLAWEQARWIDPFDGRTAQNLAFARRAIGVEPPELTWNERLAAWLPVNAWAWLAGVSLWLAIGLTVLPGVCRRRQTATTQALAAVSLTVFIVCLPAHYGVLTRTRLGVVVKKNLPLRLTPTTEGEVLTKLPAGESARELRRRGDYVLVRTAEGQGWIERREFGRICPE